MWVLTILSFVGALLAFALLTMSIASGLYYLSELVEEHSELAKRTLKRLIYIVIAIHVLLLIFDKFPFFLTSFSIFAHLIYATNLRKFPFISLSSPSFIASCVIVLLDHYFFFRYFSSLQSTRTNTYNRFSTNQMMTSSQTDAPSFNQIAAFFGICVWLVPFGLFVSLSAGELVLPTIGSDGRISPGLSSDRVKKAQGLVKQTYAAVGNWVTETMQAFGYGDGGYIGSRYR